MFVRVCFSLFDTEYFERVIFPIATAAPSLGQRAALRSAWAMLLDRPPYNQLMQLVQEYKIVSAVKSLKKKKVAVFQAMEKVIRNPKYCTAAVEENLKP